MNNTMGFIKWAWSRNMLKWLVSILASYNLNPTYMHLYSWLLLSVQVPWLLQYSFWQPNTHFFSVLLNMAPSGHTQTYGCERLLGTLIHIWVEEQMDVLLQGLSAETRTPFSIFIQVQLLQRGSSEHTEAISRIKP